MKSRWLRAWLRLFPADFRGDFGDEMRASVDEELRDARTRRGRAGVAWRNVTAALRVGPRLHLEQWRQDLRHAVRALAHAPLFSLAAVGALAFGIGSTVSTFGLADAFLFRPLPFARPAELVHLWAADRARGDDEMRASLQEFEAWRSRDDLFSGVAAFNYSSVELTGGPEPERIPAGLVSAGLFDVLGVPPLAGRALRAGDDQPGAAPVVVLGEAFWRQRFGGSPEAIGRSLAIGGVPHTIVGVMPASFVFPLPITRLWVPRILDRARLTPDVQPLQVVARLRPGVAPGQVTSGLEALAPDLGASYPALAGRTVNVVPLGEALNFAWDLFAIGSVVIGVANLLVLLAACANISSLMLGRAVTRGREVSIRAALGASRFRLVRQLMAESLVLAGCGALAGLGIAQAGLRLADRLIPMELYRAAPFAVDWRAAGVAVVLAAGAALLFGLSPALRFARANLAEAMRQDGTGGTTSRRSLRLQSLFVRKQVAFTVVLLVGTLVAARTFARLSTVDPGFETGGVTTMSLVLPVSRYADRAAVARFHADVSDAVRRVPGVDAATTVNYLPLNHETAIVPVSADGPGADAAVRRPEAQSLAVGPEYFRVLRIPIAAGRAFTPADTSDGRPVAVVNDTLARRLWPGRSPVGASLWIEDDVAPRTVVGIVGDTRQVDLGEAAGGQVFLPQAQSPWTYLRVLARGVDGREADLTALRAAVHDVDPLLPIVEVRSLRQVVDDFLLPQRALGAVLLVLGGFSLWLALFGIYGIVTCHVADRRREIGVRVALGADRSRIVRFVVGRGVRLAVHGSVAGLVLAAAGSLAARAFVPGLAVADPLVMLAVVGLIVGVAAAAAFVPARRAARVDPLRAIRG
ncbi:MAG: ABC transporter permease [Vicinamibacterales bacterium]